MNPNITVRKCEALEEFQACVAMQREIWGEADLEVEPATMFVVASQTGGQVLGAFDGDRMVGYTLAVVGLRNGAPYLHSHMTGVTEDHRGQGVGRSLKLFQREEALGRGIRLIEWTFDPLEIGNASFNLNCLGAICRRYLPNLYGITSSPLHRGLATDRLLAEWYLDSPRVESIISQELKPPVTAPARIQLSPESEVGSSAGPASLQTLQARLRRDFTQWFLKGYAAFAIHSTSAGPAYLLGPWSDF